MSAWTPLLLVAAVMVLPRGRAMAQARLDLASQPHTAGDAAGAGGTTGVAGAGGAGGIGHVGGVAGAGRVGAARGRPRAGWTGRGAVVLPILCGAAVGLLPVVVMGGAVGLVVGVVLGVPTLLGARRWIRGPAVPPAEPLRLAGAWDLLAACLRAGLPVATATRCVAEQLPASDAGALRTVAGLLAVGADPVQAWEPALAVPAIAPLARAARRTARSGAAMADAVTELAADLRAAAADRAAERAQRAGVLITGPLGLCFLPAFFCLGVLPVVIGLAGQLIQNW